VIHIGTSGWSYSSWRPGFYPAGTKPEDFLRLYSERFDTVELNTTKYRLPSEEQFRRWADAVPDGFTFAVKMPVFRLDRIGPFVERVSVLRSHLGPIRATIISARDDGLLSYLLGSIDPDLQLVLDYRHPSWDGVQAGVRVNDFDAEPFRYIRLRDPPYSDEDLRGLARELRPPAFVYFRHEDEPTAPEYAERLRRLVLADDA
jgi:hypothetical protein